MGCVESLESSVRLSWIDSSVLLWKESRFVWLVVEIYPDRNLLLSSVRKLKISSVSSEIFFPSN